MKIFPDRRQLPGLLLRYGLLLGPVLITDTPDELDYRRMARVVGGIGRVVRGLAQ